jgi:hypothetical protein
MTPESYESDFVAKAATHQLHRRAVAAFLGRPKADRYET